MRELRIPRRRAGVAAGIAGGLLSAAAILAPLPADSATANSQVLRFALVATNGYYVDNDPAGPSGGDLFGSDGPLRKSGEPIGSFRSACTAISERAAMCEASLRFDGVGTVELAGTFYTQRERNRLAVTGGTRQFRRVRGLARLSARGEGQIQRVELVLGD
jgi:hypothetical protein